MRSILLLAGLALAASGCAAPFAYTASATGSGPMLTPTGQSYNRCVTPLNCVEMVPYMDQQLMIPAKMTGPFMPY